jgi:hypothetical protein
VNAKVRELIEEFRTVMAGRGALLAATIPPVIFFVVNSLAGFNPAAYASLGSALLVGALRLVKGAPLTGALGGLGGAILAIVAVRVLNRVDAYFLPGFATGLLTAIACGLSVLLQRPLVAWTSHLFRRWPRDWYRHPQVRPAYTEVTLAWTVFFLLKAAIQLVLLRTGKTQAVAIVSVLMGWPATIVLLAVSYMYGLWRLGQLQGPSVEEFEAGDDPPWTGQRRGF